MLTDRLSTHISSNTSTSDSADLDLVGRYLAVSHQPWSDEGAFAGISIYDKQADPYHPVLVRRVGLPGGIHTVQPDPEVEAGRPYAYADAFEFGATELFVVNILTGAVVAATSPRSRRAASPPTRNVTSSTPRTRASYSATRAAAECRTTLATGTAVCGSST